MVVLPCISYTLTSVAFVSPLITILIAINLSSSINKMIKPRQTDWVAATEKRVTSITYTTSCMKGIRMLGLTETVLNMLTRFRETEAAFHSYVRSFWSRFLSSPILCLAYHCGNIRNFCRHCFVKGAGSRLQYLIRLEIGNTSTGSLQQIP